MSILCKVKNWLKDAWKNNSEAPLLSTIMFIISIFLGVFSKDIKLVAASGLIGCMFLLLHIVVRLNNIFSMLSIIMDIKTIVEQGQENENV